MKTAAKGALIVVLAAGILTLTPFAFGEESSNPISALWEAIYELQNRDDRLQSQIDELKVSAPTMSLQAEGPTSELYMEPLVTSSSDNDNLLIEVKVINDGPDRAAGVRLTTFYKMPLFSINSVSGNECQDLSRGIIRCDLGTIEPGANSVVAIEVTPLAQDIETSLTFDVSSTTEDEIPENNHKVIEIVTGTNGVPPVDDGKIDDKTDETTPQDQVNSTSSITEETNSTSTESDSESSSGTNSTSSESEGSEGASGSESPSGASSSTNSTSSETQTSEETEDSGGTSGSGSETEDNETTDDDEDDQSNSQETASGNQTSSN